MSITTEFVTGQHGQDALAGDPAAVLRACGDVLRTIHDMDVRRLPGLVECSGGAGSKGHAASCSKDVVLVHGDFGPNNVLLAASPDLPVVAVLDWEFAHVGWPIEDLAWCEWIVRMHHPAQVNALQHLWYGYGQEPPSWLLRRAEMVRRCVELERFCARWPGRESGASEWRRRAAVTESWRE